MASSLTLRIVVKQPPSGIDYALQKGKGTAYELLQPQRSAGNDLVFEFEPVIKGSGLSGPFVQGPTKQRFVYLSVGAYAGQAGAQWAGRMKIPLEGITAKMISTGGVLEARVPGTDQKGNPAFATVKDFEGWKPVKR